MKDIDTLKKNLNKIVKLKDTIDDLQYKLESLQDDNKEILANMVVGMTYKYTVDDLFGFVKD
jgi:hypothetical protein